MTAPRIEALRAARDGRRPLLPGQLELPLPALAREAPARSTVADVHRATRPGDYTFLCGDARAVLETLPARSVQTVVTSPPYFGLRDYGTAVWVGGDPDCAHSSVRRGHGAEEMQANNQGSSRDRIANVCRHCGARRADPQIGLEGTLEAYVAALVAVFRGVWRVLRDDGTAWLNLGDSYNAYNGRRGASTSLQAATEAALPALPGGYGLTVQGLKSKDLLGVPWRVALALQADGWYLRSDIIWAKRNCMPESVRDRPTRSHEYLFLLTKSPRYYYDAEAVQEPAVSVSRRGPALHADRVSTHGNSGLARRQPDGTRNLRDVLFLATTPYKGAHFAVMPLGLVEPCVLAGSSAMACPTCRAPWRRQVETPKFPRELRARPGGAGVKVGYGDPQVSSTGSGQRMQDWRAANPPRTTGWAPTCGCPDNDGGGRCLVLDPFSGAGTVGLVATTQGRDYLGIELNRAYIELATARLDAARADAGERAG